MAWQLNFTDPDTGANYPESYWIPGTMQMDKPTKTGVIVFICYVDGQARLDGKENITRRHYPVTGENWDAYFGASIAQIYANVAAADGFFEGATAV